MAKDKTVAANVEKLVEAPHLADALEGEQFRQFLDHIPFGVAVSTLEGEERVVYANLEFERVSNRAVARIQGRKWRDVWPDVVMKDTGVHLGEAIVEGEEYIGTFSIAQDNGVIAVDAWSNIISNEVGVPIFRLVALAEVGARNRIHHEEYEQRMLEKDTLLRELQHRVKNNLQMITALIRLEARNLPENVGPERFDRLAGRIGSLSLLYNAMSGDGKGDSVDLGVYISQIASAVMSAHAVEGIRLDLKIDTWPVSVNVAMPTGLVVNELLTNSLKHAFKGRDGGTILLHALVDAEGCRVIVADDGIGLEPGTQWPKQGKLGAMIVQSLRQNAKATVDVASTPGKGVRVTLFFARAEAQPDA